jgi:hypothetical protein
MEKRNLTKLARAATALVAVAALLAGCEDNVARRVVVRPPVAQPPAPPPIVAENLPLSTYPPASLPLLSAPQPYMGDVMARIEASYEAGKRAYTSGDLDAARDDFNQAMD